MRRALLVADEDDRIAATLRRRLRTAALIPAGRSFPQAHFTIGNDGAVVESAILVAGRWLDLGELSGVLFRPGRAWQRRRVATTLRQAFNGHERHAAWAAWLAAIPCPVANRLPPAWFLAPDLHRLSLAQSFASAAGLKTARTHEPLRVRKEQVYFVGSQFVSSEPDLEVAVRASLNFQETVGLWCAETGILFGGVEVRRGRHAVEVESLHPVPSLHDAPDTVVARISRLLASRFA